MAQLNDAEISRNVEKPVVATKVKGQVKWFNVKRGYGFIHRYDIDEDLFVHQTAITANNPLKGRRSVGDKEEIEFDVVQGAKGFEASNVTGPGGVAVQGSQYAREVRGRRRQGGRSRNNSEGRYNSYSESSYGPQVRGRGRGMRRGANMRIRGAPRQFFVQYRGGYYDEPIYQPHPDSYLMYNDRRFGQPADPHFRMRPIGPPTPPQGGYYEYGPRDFSGRQPFRFRSGGRGRGRGFNRPMPPRSRGDSATGPDSEGEGNRSYRAGMSSRNRRRAPRKPETKRTEPDSTATHNATVGSTTTA